MIQNGKENIINFEDKFILGKTDLNSNVYDVLFYARRNIKTTTIPPFVKIISPYSFCESAIEKVSIHPHLTHICKCAFSGCQHLKNARSQIILNFNLLESDLFLFHQLNTSQFLAM